MAVYVLLTRVSGESISDPDVMDQLNAQISQKLREEVPEIHWMGNFTVLGPYDYLDIFEAPDNETAARVALVIRSFGHGTTEIWPAMTWERFQEITHEESSSKPRLRKKSA